MAAAKRKFTLPSVEELDEEKQLTKTKPLFKALKVSSGDCDSLAEEAKGKTFDGSKVACTQANVRRSSKTNFVITEPGSSEMKNLSTDRIVSNTEPSSRDFPVISTDVSSSTQMACTVSSEIKATVGKTFRETFAFLEGTSHYKETVAKIKEKELSKPVRESVPSGSSKPKSNAIIVNPRQKGNPVLKHVRSVPWELGDIIPDYELGATTCALFLSLKYHNHYPEYIHERLKMLGQRYELRILLVLVDVPDPYQTLRELAKMAVMADCTLILSWSAEEAGRYLETYKVYENKPPDALMGQSEGDYFTKLSECLTTVKGINKTDCVSLGSTFGSLANMAKVSKEDLAFLPGFGPLKAQRLHDLFNEPFIAKKKAQDQLKEEATDTSRNGSGL